MIFRKMASNKSSSAWISRIRVSEKRSDELLIRQIQFLALKRGKTLKEDRIRKSISELLQSDDRTEGGTAK
jgi:ribosomal protein S24E